MALYSTKKARTYKVLLNPQFKFNLYENLLFHIKLCFELSLKSNKLEQNWFNYAILLVMIERKKIP